MKRYLDFILVMTEKEIKVRYKHAVLGFFWILLNPLLLMIVMGFVFQFFVPVKVDNYFLFLFSGLLPWYFFSNSLTKTTPSFYYERALIKKSKFPKESIVFSIVLSNLFHFIVSLALLILLLIGDKIFNDKYSFLNLIYYILKMTWLIPGVLWITILTSSLSLLMATINVRFRDINFITQLGVSLLFYTTPIVYTLNLLPVSIRPFFYLNPLTIILEIFQYSLLNLPIYSVNLGLVSIITTLLIAILAVVIFRKESKNFDDWL